MITYFLKIEGIQGESTDSAHRGEIDVLSWSWGQTASGSHAYSGAGGFGAGRVAMQDFSFTMQVNKASPHLFLACANGKHIGEALLTCVRQAGSPHEFLRIKLSEILVTSFQTGGTSNELRPVEQVSLNFSRIEFEYREIKADGSLGSTVKARWDLKTNKGG